MPIISYAEVAGRGDELFRWSISRRTVIGRSRVRTCDVKENIVDLQLTARVT